MWTDDGLLREMRAALRAQLPPGASLKRDRGEALFVAVARPSDPIPRTVPGFLSERRGALTAFLPDASWIERLERRHPNPPDSLSASLLRFRGQTPDRANLILFAQGLKLTDARASAPERAAYDRALRQRAAVALRGGCGGGLYAAALIDSQFNERKMEP